MSKNSDVKTDKKKAERERLAKALRENLKKRKEKQRNEKKTSSALKALMLCFLASSAHATDLNITSWGGDYQAAQQSVLFSSFSKETDKKITEHSYDGGLDEIEKLIKAETPAWDIVEVDGADLLRGCQKKYFDILNWHKIGARSEFMSGTHHNCGVGSVVWAMTLAYDDLAFKQDKPKSWADFWDVKKFPGKRALRKTAKTTLEIALMAAGIDKKKVYAELRTPKGLKKAFHMLDQLYPHLIWWREGDQPARLLATKNATMVAAYNGRIANAIQQGKKFDMVWKDALYGTDYWAVLRTSQNKDAAYQFLRHISTPLKQAELSENIAYAPTMKRSYKLIDRKKFKNMPDPASKAKMMLMINNQFWVLAEADIEEKFKKWLASK